VGVIEIVGDRNVVVQRFQFGLPGSSGLLSPLMSRIPTRRGSKAKSTRMPPGYPELLHVGVA
jgi:hypothetical protein